MRGSVLAVRAADGSRAVCGGAVRGRVPCGDGGGHRALCPAGTSSAGHAGQHLRVDRASAGAEARGRGGVRPATARAVAQHVKAGRGVWSVAAGGGGLLRHVGAPDQDSDSGDASAAAAGR